MGMKNSQQDAVAHLEARLGKDQASAATTVRLLKLITRMVEHWHSDEGLNDASTLSDTELLQRFLISDAVTECLPSREQRKRNRRTASRLDFLIKLKDFGGLMKAEAVFFLNPVLVGNGRQELPYAILKRGAIQRELDGLTREARRFLSPAAD